MELKKDNICVARQPILTSKQEIIGYEILYRSIKTAQKANVQDNLYASSNVLVNIFNNIGIENLVGSKKAFINVDKSLLEIGFFEGITSPIVLEILEDVIPDEKTVGILKGLSQRGFEIALDDFDLNKETKILIPIADYIKIDIRLTSDIDEIKSIFETAKKKNQKVNFIAEKVETREEFEKYLQLGFNLFQGFFFQKPQIVEKRKLTPSEIILIKLFNKLGENFELKEIEEIISTDVKTYLSLLKFINSAFFYLRQEIKSLRHAISLLGAKNLRAWILLMLTAKSVSPGLAKTLTTETLYRAKFMEALSSQIAQKSEFQEMAYMVGILSLIETTLRIPLEEILNELNLNQEVKAALLKKEGVLGKLLLLITAFEKGNISQMLPLLRELKLNLFAVSKCDIKAFKETEETISKLKI